MSIAKTAQSSANSGRTHKPMTHIIVDRLKKMAVIWLAVYPSVLIATLVIGDVLQDWPLPLRVLGATVVIVPIVSNVAEPGVRLVIRAIGQMCFRRGTRTP